MGGDDAYLIQSDSTNRSVLYYNTAFPSDVLNSLTIDATGSGTITLNIGAGGYSHYLGSVFESIGNYGTGSLLQSAGTNTTNYFCLGQTYSGNGTYNLSDTGQLTAQTEY